MGVYRLLLVGSLHKCVLGTRAHLSVFHPVNFAAAVVMEVRQPASGGQPVIRFNFKNGTDDEDFTTHNMSFNGWNGNGDVPLSTFLSTFEPVAVNTTLQWCGVCNQTTLRGCSSLLAPVSPSPATTASSTHHDDISPVGAGFLGAGLTIAVFLITFAVLFFLGVLSFGKGKKKRVIGLKGHDDSDGSEVRPSCTYPEVSLHCYSHQITGRFYYQRAQSMSGINL